MSILNTSQSKNWSLDVDQAGKLTLSTSGKYVDRDIDINVPAGEFGATVTGIPDKVDPKVTASMSGTLTAKLVEAKDLPADAVDGNDYLKITGSGSVTTTGSAQVIATITPTITKAGYIATGNGTPVEKTYDTAAIGVTVVPTADKFLLIKTLDETQHISITNSITGAASGDESAKDKITVSITVPEGYYKAHTYSKEFENILPDTLGATEASYLVSGYKAYDQKGNVVVGTLADKGRITLYDAESAPNNNTAVTVASSSSSITPTNAILSDTDTSGIAIQASGAVQAKVALRETGRYTQSDLTTGNLTSAAKTQYLSELTLSSGKTLSKVTNNGTITTLNGTGKISTLAGTQEITNLVGTLDIKGAQDSNTSSENSPGIIDFNGTRIVKDGALVEATATVSGNTVSYTTGWITAGSKKVANGSISVVCNDSTTTDPSITYTKDTSTITAGVSSTATEYYVKYGGSVTPGTHTAKATVTEGWITGGDYSATADPIGVTGASAEGYVYLKAAGTAASTNSIYYAADGDRAANTVPTKYQFSATAGYITAGVKKELTVFEGTYSWSTT